LYSYYEDEGMTTGLKEVAAAFCYGEAMPGIYKGMSKLPVETPPLPAARTDIAARFVVRLVAMLEKVPEHELFSPTRGSESVSRLRQIAMYLLHTSLSVPYGEVARAFGRDRTTVSHACRQVEDMRDDPLLDTTIGEIETLLAMLAPMFSPVRGA
jgi:hypothetical protein